MSMSVEVSSFLFGYGFEKDNLMGEEGPECAGVEMSSGDRDLLIDFRLVRTTGSRFELAEKVVLELCAEEMDTRSLRSRMGGGLGVRRFGACTRRILVLE